jgi:antitoxin HigA-1
VLPWPLSGLIRADRLAQQATQNQADGIRADTWPPASSTHQALAVAIGVPPRRINEIVHGKRRISADTALRLARCFGTTEQFWLNLQGRYDLEVARDRLAPKLQGNSAAGTRLTGERPHRSSRDTNPQ